MATVKGDVHDIGKNIVGVVLQCNNYEVVDLGVMVPAAKILETARAEKADIIGLSGLITPSLDEMCHVAAEMERQGFELPLMIGGATTSRVHTAVKIHPNYKRGQAVYVNDASRAVGVAQALMSANGAGAYVAELRGEYAKIAAAHARAQDDKARLPLVAARAQCAQARLVGRLCAAEAELPRHQDADRLSDRRTGRLHRLDAVLPDLGTERQISPPFSTTRNSGRRARSLYEDARAMLDKIVAERWFKASAVVGFWPANSVGRRYPGLSPTRRAAQPIAVLHSLRQQLSKREGRAQRGASRFRGAAR